MKSIYNLTINTVSCLSPLAKFVNDKSRKFIQGRQQTFQILENFLTTIGKSDVYWFHCASLGEYEQAVPVIELLKEQSKDIKVLVTFFSPSGYENKKNAKLVDAMCYLPLDTQKNVDRFLDLLKPTLAVFVKYEFWPNYLFGLQQRGIPSVVICALFREGQFYFKPQASYFRKAIQTLSHVFVQNQSSLEKAKELGCNSVSISGDTRCDRVILQRSKDNTLGFVEVFKNNREIFVIGSSWDLDAQMYLDFVNQLDDDICCVIAPHEIGDTYVKELCEKIQVPHLRFSHYKDQDLTQYKVLIVDAIGYLGRIYAYGDVAYVGGGMGTKGLHNILEAATFKMPIVIGKNYQKFPEAVELIERQGIFSIDTPEKCSEILNRLYKDKAFREKSAQICKNYIDENKGSSQHILSKFKALV